MDTARRVAHNRERFLDIITGFAAPKSAEDELHRSVKVLAGSWWEIESNNPPELSRTTVFMPSNNLLYSYILFGVVPALYSREVMLRPSSRSTSLVGDLHSEFSRLLPAEISERISLTEVSQRRFVDESRKADIIVFTGRYENGLDIIQKVGETPRMLMMGSGPNPFVVGPMADLARTTRSLLRARLYNSGQDCLGPDIAFVHQSVLEPFVKTLTSALDGPRAGNGSDPWMDVAPLVYPDAIEGAVEFLGRHEGNIVAGGVVDAASGRIDPHVLVWDTDTELHPDELFSPLFVVVPYSEAGFITEWASRPQEMSRGMYMSVFGEPGLNSERVGTAIVRYEASALDAEDGNQPFGGFGEEASSVHHAGGFETRPILLSAEAARLDGRGAHGV